MVPIVMTRGASEVGLYRLQVVKYQQAARFLPNYEGRPQSHTESYAYHWQL